jgi:protein associated with RNAse G/E
VQNQQFTINSLRFDLSIRRSWKCHLIAQNDPALVFVGKFEATVEHSDLGRIEKGTVSYEYYWLDRWYNIFSFFNPDQTFRNFYCNINMPPTLGNGVLDYVDLDIDLLVWPDYRTQVLDMDEFESFGYPDAIREKAFESLAELQKMISTREFPFGI